MKNVLLSLSVTMLVACASAPKSADVQKETSDRSPASVKVTGECHINRDAQLEVFPNGDRTQKATVMTGTLGDDEYEKNFEVCKSNNPYYTGR